MNNVYDIKVDLLSIFDIPSKKPKYFDNFYDYSIKNLKIYVKYELWLDVIKKYDMGQEEYNDIIKDNDFNKYKFFIIYEYGNSHLIMLYKKEIRNNNIYVNYKELKIRELTNINSIWNLYGYINSKIKYTNKEIKNILFWFLVINNIISNIEKRIKL